MRLLVQRLKYHHQREAAAVLGDMLTPLFWDQSFEVVTAVPVATSRRRLRGYNQSELIARRLAHNLRLPYQTYLLRNRNFQQVGQSRTQRLKQVRGAFRVRGKPARQCILLVDDVCTTGATLSECARVLYDAGATHVHAAVTARD